MIQVSVTLRCGEREIGVDTIAVRSEVGDATRFIDLILKPAAARLAEAVREGSLDPTDLAKAEQAEALRLYR